MLEDRCETQSSVVSFIRPVSSPESHLLCKNLSPSMSSHSSASCRKGRRGESVPEERRELKRAGVPARPPPSPADAPHGVSLQPWRGLRRHRASSGLIIVVYRSLRQGIGLSLPPLPWATSRPTRFTCCKSHDPT